MDVGDLLAEIFVPDLAEHAKRLGSTDFSYTDVHGEADVKHSEVFAQATDSEKKMGYLFEEREIDRAVTLAVHLIWVIYEE